jgi:hypothetical protein
MLDTDLFYVAEIVYSMRLEGSYGSTTHGSSWGTLLAAYDLENWRGAGD